MEKIQTIQGGKDMENKIYDVVILGGGPAGLAAGIYAGRAKLSVLLIEKGADGGQIILTHEIENYPGQPNIEGMSGQEILFSDYKEYEAGNTKFGIGLVSAIDEESARELAERMKKVLPEGS